MSRLVRMIGAGRAEVACTNCDARTIVEREEDGVGSNAVATCHVHGCGRELCDSCIARCIGCDQPVCDGHATNYDGGVWCACCMAQIVAEGAELAAEAFACL